MDRLLSYASDTELVSLRTSIPGDGVNHTFDIMATTQPGEPLKPNEDTFAAVGKTGLVWAGVFDGATSLESLPGLGEQSGAHFASHFLRDTFGDAVTEDVHTPRVALRRLNKWLLDASLQLEGATLTNTRALPTSGATLVRLDSANNYVSFAHVADAIGIAYFEDDTSRVFTNDRNKAFDDKMHALIRDVAREEHITPRQARYHPRVKRAHVAMYNARNNNPDGTGCGVVNGDPAMDRYIQTGSLPMNKLVGILLLSDGMPPLDWDMGDESTRQRLLTTIRQEGFERIIDYGRAAEAADPDWQQFTRYKNSDDATGLLIMPR